MDCAHQEYLFIGRPFELMLRQADQARLWAYYEDVHDYPYLVTRITTLAEKHDWSSKPSPLQQGVLPFEPEGPLSDAVLDARELLNENQNSTVPDVNQLHELVLRELKWRAKKQMVVELREVRMRHASL